MCMCNLEASPTNWVTYFACILYDGAGDRLNVCTSTVTGAACALEKMG
jgi:hypothetical protein